MAIIIPKANISHEVLDITSHYYINFKYGQFNYAYSDIYDGFSYAIDRSAAEDVYNYKLNRGHTRSNKMANNVVSMLPSIMVNNKDKFSSYPARYDSVYNVKILEQMSFLHNSKFGSPHLVDTEQLTIGGDTVSVSTTNPIWRKVMFINNNNRVTKNIKVGNFDSMYRFDSIAQIYGGDRFDKNFIEDDYAANTSEKLPDTLPSYKYSYVYVVPVKPSVKGENNIIANIYYAHDSGVDHDWYDDLRVKTDKLNSSSVKGLETYFYKDIDKTEKLDVNEKFDDPYKVGEIRVSDYTYFDYEKGKMQKGYDTSAIQGDPIPFNYDGNFSRQINFSLNHVYPNISLNLSKDVEVPYLNPSNGKVRLTIKEIKPNSSNVPMNYFDHDDIKLIRNGSIKTLTGFKRLTIEK